MAEPLTLEAMKLLLGTMESNINANTKEEIKEITKEIQEAKQEIKDSVKKSLDEVNAKIVTLENLNSEKDEIIRKQNYRITDLEIEIKKRNVVFYNLMENEDDSNSLESLILLLLEEKTGYKFEPQDIESVYRLGKLTNTPKIRPVLVSFSSIKSKRMVMEKMKDFINAGLGISDDFPKEVGEKRKLLIPVVKILKSENMKAVIRKDKLFVNGVEWSQEKIDFEMNKRSSVEKMEVGGDEETPKAAADKIVINLEESFVEEGKDQGKIIVDPIVEPQSSCNENAEQIGSKTPTAEHTKRPRSSDDENTPLKNQKQTKLKTTIIGTNTNLHRSSGRHPIKDVLKRQVASMSKEASNKKN